VAYGRRSRGQSQVFEDASDGLGRGEEGDQLAPSATEVADEDLDGIGPAEQLGPGQALVATGGQLCVGGALVGEAGEALRGCGTLGDARRGLLGVLAARCAWWWRSGDDVISPAGGGSEDAVVGEHRPSRSWDERHESLEEGGGLEAKSLSAVGEGTSETKEELPFRSEGELLGGEGRTEDVACEPFAAVTFAGGDTHGGVQGEAGGASAERSGSRGAARGSGIAEARDGLTRLRGLPRHGEL
jgi:hypothetical protein